MKFALVFEATYEDLGDDSGDSCALEVEMDNSEWLKLIDVVLEENPAFNDTVAEWVGLHYRRMFAHQALSDKAQWVERYLDSTIASLTDINVIFEFVYPDEDGDSVSASLYLETGTLTLAAGVPDDITGNQVRVRIWDGEKAGDGDDYAVYFRREAKDKKSGQWTLYAGMLDTLRKSHNYKPSALRTKH